MSNVLRSRSTVPTTTVPADAAALQVRLDYAMAIAGAKQALPPSYVGNPGAVLLATEWAQAHEVDLLTTLQTVNFVHGRPVVDATMQRALANRSGYDVRPVEIDEDHATVVVRKGSEELARVTYTMRDAEIAGLDKKENWKKNPKAMLVARATTTAMRWHAPEVMVGIWAEDEDLSDPVTTLTEPAKVEPVDDDIEEAQVVEVVEAPDVPSAEAPDADLYTLLMTTSKGLDADTRKAFTSYGESKSWPKVRKNMTQEQLADALQWIEEHG